MNAAVTRATGGDGSDAEARIAIATKRYLGRRPAPFADYGPPLDRWTWGVIGVFVACVAAGAAVGWIAPAVGGWLWGSTYGGLVGVALAWWVEGNTEPYDKQLPDYLIDLITRRCRYQRDADAPPARGTRRGPLGLLRPLNGVRPGLWGLREAVVGAAPAWRLLAPGGVVRPMAAGENGVLTRPDGQRVALAAVGPVNSYERRSPEDRAATGRAFGEIPLYLKPQQRAQFVIQNRARPVGEALADFDRRQAVDPVEETGDRARDQEVRARHARQVEYLAARRAGVERRYAEHHIPDVRHYLAVAESVPLGLAMARERLERLRGRAGWLERQARALAVAVHTRPPLRRARGLWGRPHSPRARLSGGRATLELIRAATAAEVVVAAATAREAVESAGVEDQVTERDVEFGFQVADVQGRVRATGARVEPLAAGDLADLVIRSLRGPVSADAALGDARCARPASAASAEAGRAAGETVTDLHAVACAVDVDARPLTYLRLRTPEGVVMYVRTLAVRKLPATVDYGWIAPLGRLPFPSDVTLYVEGRAKEQEEDRIERATGQAEDLNSKREDRTGRRKGRLSRMERENTQTAEELDNPDVTVAGVALLVTVYAPDARTLRQRTATARAALRGLRCTPGPGWGHQKALWLATRPLGLGDAAAALPELTPVVRTLFPCTSGNPGSGSGMPLGLTVDEARVGGAEAVSLDFDDPEIGTQQLGLGGLPNSGKSVLGNAALVWSYFEGGNIVVAMDRSGTYAATCEELGGTYFIPLDEQTEAQRAINPYEMVMRAMASPQARVSRLLTMHEHMFGRADESERMSNWQFQKLSAALGTVVRADYGARVGLDRRTPYPLERDLIAELEKIAVGTDKERRREKEDLIAGFMNYVGDGPWAALADRETDADLDGRLVVFDTRYCSEGKNAIVAFWIMETFVEWAGLRLQGITRHNGTPAMVVELIDEGWSVLEVAAPHISKATLTSRHVRRRFIFAIQFLSKLFDHPLGQDLANVVPWWVIGKLRNERVGQESGTGWLARPLDIPLREALDLPHLSIEAGEYAEMLVVKRGLKGTNHAPVRVMTPSEEDLELFKSNPTEKDERAALMARYGSLHQAMMEGAAALRARRAERARGRGTR